MKYKTFSWKSIHKAFAFIKQNLIFNSIFFFVHTMFGLHFENGRDNLIYFPKLNKTTAFYLFHSVSQWKNRILRKFSVEYLNLFNFSWLFFLHVFFVRCRKFCILFLFFINACCIYMFTVQICGIHATDYYLYKRFITKTDAV